MKGRRALITGGASGIGLATAHRLESAGASVVIVDIEERADIRADVSRPEELSAAFSQAGEVDIVVLNAGITIGVREIDALTDEDYRRITGVNVDGVVFGVREAVRSMKRSGGGAIVVTASIAGINAYPPDPVYALTKHAVVGLVRSLPPHLQGEGITINAICPGIVDTPLLGDSAARLKDLGFSLIEPNQVAEAVLLAIESGGTGDVWVVQAGREPLVYKFRGVPGPRVPGAEGMEVPWDEV